MSLEDERASALRAIDNLGNTDVDHERRIAALERADIPALLRAIEQRLAELPTNDEVTKLRELLESKKRKDWLWDTLKVWATWVAAILVGITMSWEALKRLAKALVA